MINTASDNSCLEPRSISQLKGLRFRIPSYQRGYRWERLQVEQLLDDIAESNEKTPYYLQPVVVAPAPQEVGELPADERFDYDLIDGQQRITTLLLVLKAFSKLGEMPSSDDIQNMTALGQTDELKARFSLSSAIGSEDVSADYTNSV